MINQQYIMTIHQCPDTYKENDPNFISHRKLECLVGYKKVVFRSTVFHICTYLLVFVVVLTA